MTGNVQDSLILAAGLSLSTGDPYCELRWGDNSGQITPDEARIMGMHLIAAAESAESDSAIFHVMRDKLGLAEDAVKFMSGIKAWRNEYVEMIHD